MASYTDPPEEGRGRRDLFISLAFFFLSALALYLPAGTQGQLAEGLRASVLRPFILTQQAVARARHRTEDALRLQAQLDTLAGIVASQSTVLEENVQLRALLDLHERVPGTFIHANLLRPGTSGAASMFLLDAGADQGLRAGDPVLMRDGRIGLVGVIREVSPGGAIGLDWSHPDFRASAMTADGQTNGLVEPRPGLFRGASRLLLNAIPYFERLEPGTLITTSGLGGVYPRGIPIGEVLEIHQEEGRWLSEYWLRPIVDPARVTHVLVVRGGAYSEDLLDLLENPEGLMEVGVDTLGRAPADEGPSEGSLEGAGE
jgi:rod shape-determining protein MreC